MSDRMQNSVSYNQTNCAKMPNVDVGPRKTLFVLVIVVGCFSVLWPKVFYPMLVGSANQYMKPSDVDKTTGCCDVISETDVNTIKIMSELCSNIIKQTDEIPLSGKEIISQCRSEILKTCGIDLSAVLQEQVRLGHTFKHILEEVRSLNGSLCLKYNFGISPWRLGVSHRVVVNFSIPSIRQERPSHLRPEMLHPALRERGRAIPQPNLPAKQVSTPKVLEGRPGPIPGMRPPMGGAGHVVSPPQKGTSSMSVIMPIYTIGIVIFFSYTLMKVIFKKQPEGVGRSLYPPVDPDLCFRKEVFESDKSRLAPRLGRDGVSSKLVVNAMSALLDEVDQELEARRRANEVLNQNETTTILSNGNISNGSAIQPHTNEQEQASVKVLGMEMTASCEGGQRWSRPNTPVIPVSPPPQEPLVPPQAIYLEGSLPAQSQLLVSESATETQVADNVSADPAVVLAGKMTLSLISLDSAPENENENETSGGENEEIPVDNKEVDSDNELEGDDIVEESKYTTASSLTAAENEVSEDEKTDGEVEEEVEIIEELEIDDGEIQENGDEREGEESGSEIEEEVSEDDIEIGENGDEIENELSGDELEVEDNGDVIENEIIEENGVREIDTEAIERHSSESPQFRE